jgi:hypothetical protein
MWFPRSVMFRVIFRVRQLSMNVLLGPLNPLNAELNPICHLLVLLGAQLFLHISRIPEDEGTSLLSKISNRSATDTSSYPLRPEFSQIPL